MSKRMLLCLFMSAFAGTEAFAQKNDALVKSPDSQLSVNVQLREGKAYYSVTYAGRSIIEPSRIGLLSDLGDFSQQLQWAGREKKLLQEQYSLDRGKVSRVDYKANELRCAFINAGKDTLEVLFRVSNRDVAFSYRIPKNGKGAVACTVEKEVTGFDFPAKTTTFITQQALPMTGWMRTKPSYEEPYSIEEAVGVTSQNKVGYTFPALFHVAGQAWALISETGVGDNYVGTRLSEGSTDGLYTIAFPQSGENNGQGPASATAPLPFQTSWKTITVGNDLKPIVASTVATDVVKPVVKSDKLFTPGRATWSWIIWQDSSANYKDQVAYIDLAASLKAEYVLIDVLWDVLIGKEKMAELARYAASKGVGLILWYNSNGSWNDAPYTPKNRMSDRTVRREEMAWLQKIGIKGLKVDFFGGDKQVTMQLYHDILADAAEYGLVINFHGATLPRGWDRMYPNWVSSEAVLASENLVFQQSFCDNYPQTATIYPFTRNAVAPMDFAPVFLNKRLNRNPEKGNFRRTTDAFEMATAVLFFSPVQHWGLTPDNLEGTPEYLLDFIRNVPTTWDETRLIDGYPGKYCVIARRKGSKWYVAAVNGEPAEKTITIKLPMLENKEVSIIKDGEGQASVLQKQKVGTSVTITLKKAGGAVLFN
ncbi:glycoside hydrolase family 97 protein [Chitinophaga sancti]|uniref:Glycoside hydrolase family 97 catalytic domain-containing protein n=1 Tax=Chitinophaga sancti TaxID=1004 RepID=A0A1K1M1T2_9BACT|nr:glycoside hydrolase family 97 protein [Chitinophaga sancti]WQD64696.1 glycoside hydrolase family 97 catalytic domain-containing protein [Chitinophaga sancti]WQG89682.1 glycoside hydrolase family 97 catalytic domain-containing protein [Chitinophaga sancti]SFW17108.1 Glycosyl-hydrolase 97 C-terminal, oligomerisation [Chitinophaga sancti]